MILPPVVTIVIPDADGTPQEYRLKFDSAELLKAGTGALYRVWNPDGSGWRCTCDSFKFCKFPKHCKHTEALEVDMAETDFRDLEAKLAAPFGPEDLRFKPGVVSGNRALAMPYVDARAIMRRLDEAFSMNGWQDEYEFLEGGSVLCRLRCRFGEQWVTKMDVGSPSEQPDEGDRVKAAVSDALKRAAVKFGVGRYLYRAPQQWFDYDPQKRRFTQKPTLPGQQTVQAKPVQKEAPPAGSQQPAPLPKDGAELKKRLENYDAKLAATGFCQPGELVAYVVDGLSAAHGEDMTKWPKHVIPQAVQEIEVFKGKKRNEQRTAAK